MSAHAVPCKLKSTFPQTNMEPQIDRFPQHQDQKHYSNLSTHPIWQFLKISVLSGGRGGVNKCSGSSLCAKALEGLGNPDPLSVMTLQPEERLRARQKGENFSFRNLAGLTLSHGGFNTSKQKGYLIYIYIYIHIYICRHYKPACSDVPIFAKPYFDGEAHSVSWVTEVVCVGEGAGMI